MFVSGSWNLFLRFELLGEKYLHLVNVCTSWEGAGDKKARGDSFGESFKRKKKAEVSMKEFLKHFRQMQC